MKYLFPLINDKELANDFVHSQFIGIYDDDTNKTELIPTSGTDGKPIDNVFFDSIVNKGLKSVISPYYSFMTLRVFKENNIETIKAKSTILDENIQHLKNNTLKPFDIYEALLNGGDCATECSSCGTSCSEN